MRSLRLDLVLASNSRSREVWGVHGTVRIKYPHLVRARVERSKQYCVCVSWSRTSSEVVFLIFATEAARNWWTKVSEPMGAPSSFIPSSPTFLVPQPSGSDP